MLSDTTSIRVLQRAVQLLGGEVQLAIALNVSPEVLTKWLSGEARPTTKAYFTALDIVTRHVEQGRRRLIDNRRIKTTIEPLRAGSETVVELSVLRRPAK
jgi:hypothetical protein